MKLVTVDEMRYIERAADRSGLRYAEMMQNAGRGVAEVVRDYFQDDGLRALALVGSGNNGGDALVALTVLMEHGWRAAAYLMLPRQENDTLIKTYVHAGGELLHLSDDESYKNLDKALEDAEVIIDGVLGTGATLPLKPSIADVFDHIKIIRGGIPIIAVDCPSGVDCDSGKADPSVLPADVTVCMAAVKAGLVAMPAFRYVGTLHVVPIGLSDDLLEWRAVNAAVVDSDLASANLPKRDIDSHKGTFGTAMIVAGSVNYTGAAYLAASAAYRIGAGLVQVGLPACLHPVLAGQIPEATWLLLPHEMGVLSHPGAEILLSNLDRATSLLLGPGWGMESTTTLFLKYLLEGSGAHRGRSNIGFVTGSQATEKDQPRVLPPCVIDADGLKHLSKIENWWTYLPEETILTPHPGEMSVLTGVPLAEIQQNRIVIARDYAARWRKVVVLKGALTVIAEPNGAHCIIPVASAALARAGTGDVLAGIIVGLRAQGLPAYEAAYTGAWIHAQCGLLAEDLLGTSASVLAGDLLDHIPDVLHDLESW